MARKTVVTCDRCGTEEVNNLPGEIRPVAARMQHESDGQMLYAHAEVCPRCAEILRAMLSHQIRRWRLNVDRYTDKQLASWREEDGLTPNEKEADPPAEGAE